MSLEKRNLLIRTSFKQWTDNDEGTDNETDGHRTDDGGERTDERTEDDDGDDGTDGLTMFI